MTTATLEPPVTGPTIPDRSLRQRLEALAKANDIRERRATLKQDLKAGRVNIITLLLDPPEYALTMKVWNVLLAAPKYGRVKSNRTLNQCQISSSKTLGGLTDRQRTELAREFQR